MKSATEQPAVGQVVERTTRTRVLPLDPSSQATRTTPDYWEYLASLDKAPEEWDRHIIYIYRTDPKPSTPADKCSQFMAMPDGTRVAMSDKEEIEFSLAKRWGGREYRFIVKRNSERITETRVTIDAPPKPIIPLEPSNGTGATVTPYPMTEAGATAQVAGQAMNALTSQERQSAEIGFAAMRTASEVMQRFAQAPTSAPPPPSETDQLMKMLMLKMMEKLVDRLDAPPPPAPAAAAASAENPLVTKILEAGLERVLNPVSSAPAVSAGAELVRSLPSIASYVTDSLREWRTGMEAQRDTVALARGAAPAQPTAGIPQARVLPPPTAAPNPAPGAGPMGAPSLEFIETRIMQILQEPISADDAASDVLVFLNTVDGPNPPQGKSLVEQLVVQGETGLVQLFGMREKLRPATANMPRLVEFIRAFLKMHAEDKEAESGERKPN